MIEQTQVKKIWDESESQAGYGSGRNIAAAMHEAGLIPPRETGVAGRFIDHFSIEPYLYEGAIDTVRTLADAGNHVTIWTQGEPKQQLYKIATAGIIRLRNETPELHKRIHAHTDPDKISTLETVIPQVQERGAKRIVIVDDKAKNIVSANQRIAELREDGAISPETEISCVWINQGRTKDQVPEGITLDEFKAAHPVIEDIRELPGLLEGLDPVPTEFLIDFDHTLANTGAWRGEIQRRITDNLNREPVLGSFSDVSLGLDTAKPEERYSSGMSGAQVVRISRPSTFGEGPVERTVVKCGGKGERRKLHREVRGYHLIADSPLVRHALPLDATQIDRGVISTPFFEGTQLRDALRQGTLPAERVLQIQSELFYLKRLWWSGQEKQSPRTDNSMQRNEWSETRGLLLGVVGDSLNSAIGLTPEDPVEVSIGGKILIVPSLQKQVELLDGFYGDERSAPYSLNAHNDATGANIVVDPVSREWRIFDYEWAGPNDPAEAYARMIKAITTATAQEMTYEVKDMNGNGRPDLHFTFSRVTRVLQEYGLANAVNMGESLGDETFDPRVRWYLAGSYLREAALSARRGLPSALFGLTQAGQLLDKSSTLV